MKTMLIDVKSKPETCPKCGGKVVDIIYGMPAPETCELSTHYTRDSSFAGI